MTSSLHYSRHKQQSKHFVSSVMMVTRRLLLSLLVLLMLWKESSQLEEDDENANYHLVKLKNKVEDIKNSLITADSKSLTHNISKRSTRNSNKNHADDLILSSLSSYCNDFNSDPDISKYLTKKAEQQPLSTRDMRGYTRYTSNQIKTNGVWEPNAFPVKVLAQREGHKTWLVFHIAHTENARVSRLDFHDFEEVALKFPESECQTVISKARFALSSPICHPCSNGHGKIEQFRISSGLGKNGIRIYINICKWLDSCKLLDSAEKNIVSARYRVPVLRLKSSADSNEFIKYVSLPEDLGNSTTFYVTFSNSSEVDVTLRLQEFNSSKVFQSTSRVLPRLHVPNNIPNSNELFTVEVIHKRQCGLTPDAVYLLQRRCVTLKITIKPMKGLAVSGQMSFLFHPDFEVPFDHDIGMEVTVPLVLPDRIQKKLPSEQIYFTSQTRFWCNRLGNFDPVTPEFGNRCTLQCQANGMNISHIYISKKTSTNRITKFVSGSYVLHDKAAAILDVGPSNDDIDGEYECTVVNKQGETRKNNLKLYTRLFTKINNFKLESNDTETALVTCNAFGDQSVNMSILVCGGDCENKEQLHFSESINHEMVVSVSDSEHYKNISVSIPWRDLRFPKKKLFCEAEGERGKDFLWINLKGHYQNTYGIFPSVNKSEMHVVKLKNSSLLASCTATGERPLETVMYLNKPFQRDHLELLNKVTKSGKGSEKVVITRLLARSDPGFDFSDLYVSHLICEARNSHGTDTKELRDVFYYILR